MAIRITSFLPRVFALAILGAAVLPALAGSAGADTPQSGKVRLGWNIEARYSGVDLDAPGGRQALLAGVEKAAHKLCDGAMVRSDRRACEQHVVATFMTNASETERTALALAQSERGLAERGLAERGLAERNTVAQAMR